LNIFETDKQELMTERLEDLLEQVFSGSYTRGCTEDVIREKVQELRQWVYDLKKVVSKKTPAEKEREMKKGLVVVAHPDKHICPLHK